MGGGVHVMKRIPRIKFPPRHSASGTLKEGDAQHTLSSSSDVPAPPMNTAVGGKASLQPKRTPVSNREIEAVLLGGCF